MKTAASLQKSNSENKGHSLLQYLTHENFQMNGQKRSTEFMTEKSPEKIHDSYGEIAGLIFLIYSGGKAKIFIHTVMV